MVPCSYNEASPQDLMLKRRVDERDFIFYVRSFRVILTVFIASGWLPFLKCTKPPHSFHLQPKKSPIVDCSCCSKNSVPDFLVDFSCYIEWTFNCHEEKKTIHLCCFGCVAVQYTMIIHNIHNTQSAFR